MGKIRSTKMRLSQIVIVISAWIFLATYVISQTDDSLEPDAIGEFPISLTSGNGFSLFFAGFFAVFGGADVWQRLYAAKDSNSAKIGFVGSAIGWIIFATLLILLAEHIRLVMPAINPNDAFFELLNSGLPEWIVAMFALLLFAALLSTADTELLAISVIANRQFGGAGASEAISTKMTKYFIIAFTAIASLLALISSTQLVGIYFFFLYITMVLGPVAFIRILGRGNTKTAMVGLIIGSGTLVTLGLLNQLESGAYPLLIIVPSLFGLIFKAKNNQTVAVLSE